MRSVPGAFVLLTGTMNGNELCGLVTEISPSTQPPGPGGQISSSSGVNLSPRGCLQALTSESVTLAELTTIHGTGQTVSFTLCNFLFHTHPSTFHYN